MAAYRKSNKKNTRRKKTQFKKGHKSTSTVKEQLVIIKLHDVYIIIFAVNCHPLRATMTN
jgi:hypothetical protein